LQNSETGCCWSYAYSGRTDGS